LRLPGSDSQDDPEELRLLAESAGAHVVGLVTGSRKKPDAATFLGSGKAAEVGDAVARDCADIVIVDHPLSPAQERNLERAVKCRVLDRTGLILDIFAQRAHSAEGKLQVELAQLEHLATRLVRGWTHLGRQKGGIGLRGPGETQLEVDRRLIRDRIKKLNERLQQVSKQRQSRRRSREKVPIPTVSLVGYTNAGKSSLFNRLTGSTVYAADQLFATLDPTMRRLSLPAGGTGGVRPAAAQSVILADTVGFIRHLPHQLVEAFKSTLEEVTQSALLLHVVDNSSAECQQQIEQVNGVLSEIGAADLPQIVVFNKIDLGEQPASVERDAQGVVRRVWLSATTGAGVDLLLGALGEFFSQHKARFVLRLPPQAARLRARVFDKLAVIDERVLSDGRWELEVSMDTEEYQWLTRQDGFDVRFVEPSEANRLAAVGS